MIDVEKRERPMSGMGSGLNEEYEAVAGKKVARGKCSPNGNACDADRIIGRLEEAPDEIVRAVVLCDACFCRTPLFWKRTEVRYAPAESKEETPGGPGRAKPVKGRTRKG